MILLEGTTAVTVDGDRRVIPDAGILVDGSRIVAVGGADELSGARERAEVVDARGTIAIPGLIDAHAHADQSLLRGLGDDLHWMPFLADVVGPYLASRTQADVVAAYRLSMLEMLLSGTTCFVSPNVSPRDDLDLLTEAVAALGIRAVLARYVTPTWQAEDGGVDDGAGLDATSEAVRRWNGAAGGLVSMWFGLHTPRLPGDAYVSGFYPAVARRAAELGTRLTYHFGSEPEDREYYLSAFDAPPMAWAREHGVLGPDALVINACQVSSEEIDILAETATNVAHSPVANMKMATGVAPVVDLRERGVNVSLGTDGGANNNSHDMLAEMKAACLLQALTRGRAGALGARDALEMATMGGARALGRDRQLGSLEAGKLADLVLLDATRANLTPVHDPVSAVVYAATAANVRLVMVDGRVLVRDGAPVHVDAATVVAEAERAATRIRQAAPHAGNPPSRRERL